VLLAVIGAAAILACAGSSAALFLSSASSKALQQFVAARCPDQALPRIGVATPGQSGRNGPYDNAQYATVNEAAYAAATSAGLPRPYQQLVASAQPQAGPDGGTPAPATLFYSAPALGSVDKLSSAGGEGVWISDDAARLWHLSAGDRLPIQTTGPQMSVRVAGIYKDLKSQPTKPFWCSMTNLYQNPGLGVDTRQKLLIFTSASQFIAVEHRIHDNPTMQWISPMHDPHLTVSKAQRLVQDQQQAKSQLARTVHRIAAPGTVTVGGAELSALINQTHLIRHGLTGPVVPIAIGGSVLALLLIGAAGSYWADRRAREVRLLSSRGVGPGALAVKAALELTAPAVLGTALGWGLAIGLVKWLGPSGDLDHQAPITALWTALIGLVCGVLLLSLVAGLRARNATERPVGHRRGWVAVVPWELLVLAGAAVLFIRLRGEHGVRLVNDIAQVNLLLVAFPLVFLVGGAALVVRLIALGLPLVRRASAGWPAAGYFAVRRITGAPIVSVVLLAAASMPVAVLVYSGAITSTSRTSVDAKAFIYAGSNISVSTVDSPHRTAAMDRVGTILTRYSDVKLGAEDAEVLAIDPNTFARAAYWDSRLDGASLNSLLQELKQHRSDGKVPAIVLRYTNGHATDLQMNSTSKSLDIIANPKAFPGQRDQYSDLVVVDAARLGRVDSMVANFHEVWSKHSAAATEKAMRAQRVRPLFVTTPQSTIKSSNYLAVTWTFGYLEALAALVGLIAVGGLLLYLATRQRSRTASYAMARRMGMSARSHLRSLVIELGALLVAAWVVGAALAMVAVLMVYERLDVDPSRRPVPLLTLPVPALVGSAIAVVVVALVAAWSAQRSAGRADVSEVMRLDA
jgi:putative ABC transport system permease protein